MIGSLPILVRPDERESATSFLLRTFTRNRVRAMTVFNTMSIPWSPALQPSALPALATLANVDLPWLRTRVPLPHPSDRWLWEWRGRIWRGQSTVKAPGMRLCPACVHEAGICRMEWDLGFYVACPIHHAPLIDRCPHCSRPIRWHRPAIDVCACKMLYLRQPQVALSPLLTEWLLFVSSALAEEDGEVQMPKRLLSMFPAGLSLDGMWRVVRAFGIQPSPATKIDSTSTAAPNVDPVAVLERGLLRLSCLGATPELKQMVHASGLRSQCSCGISEGDRRFAINLLRRLGLPYRPGRNAKFLANQMELFHDEA